MIASTAERSRITVWLLTTLAGALVGFVYVSAVYPPGEGGDGSLWIGVIVGTLIGGSTAAFELWFVSHPYSRIRRLSFIPAFIVRVLAQFCLISLSIAFVQIIYDWLYGTSLFTFTSEGIIGHLKDVSFSLVVSAVIVFYMQMRLFIGGANLRKLVFGVYNNPVVEERIFMILDIPGTTAAAQAIGDTSFHRYINQLFILFDPAITRHGGEIHSYVGDAVIAVWPLTQNPQHNARILLALAEVIGTTISESARIEKLFGVKPGVRAAIHGGSVVAGEMGNSKRQITYLGDVMNIASRIESKTKELERPFLVSQATLARIAVPEGFEVEPIGNHALKGSREKLALAELRWKPKNKQ